MKKIFLTFILISSLFFANFCLALNAPKEDILEGIANNTGYATNITDTSLSETIGGYIKVILGMVGVVFFVLTFYAGFLWMTASGDDSKIEKAKGIFSASIIGLAIIIFSYSITVMIVKYTTDVSTPTAPVGN